MFPFYFVGHDEQKTKSSKKYRRTFWKEEECDKRAVGLRKQTDGKKANSDELHNSQRDNMEIKETLFVFPFYFALFCNRVNCV